MRLNNAYVRFPFGNMINLIGWLLFTKGDRGLRDADA